MKNIKIAALQFSCCSQVQENIDKAETMVREAASNGANLILLPELFERPYFCQEKRYDYYDYALPLTENPAVRWSSARLKGSNMIFWNSGDIPIPLALSVNS